MEYSEIFPASKVPYEADDEVGEALEEIQDAVNEKPFDASEKKVLKAFGIDPSKVEVWRHIIMPDLDYSECIIYTPVGEDPEGEDHDFAVEDVYPNEDY